MCFRFKQNYVGRKCPFHVVFLLKNKNVKKTARPDFSINAVGGQCRRAGSEVGSR